MANFDSGFIDIELLHGGYDFLLFKNYSKQSLSYCNFIIVVNNCRNNDRKETTKDPRFVSNDNQI